MSTIFEQLSQAVADHDILWTAFRSAEQAAKDITRATAERISADRKQVDERREALEMQSRDPSRPEVVRRLALQELERMQGVRFEPTETEVAAFDSAMKDAADALRDFATVKARLQELFGSANHELQTLRSSTLGDGSRDDDLAKRWLAGVQQGFDRLVREGGGSCE